MRDQVSNCQHGIRLVLRLYVCVPLGNIFKVIQCFEGNEAFGDSLWREELGIAREPIHPVHLAGQTHVFLAGLLHHIDGVFVNKSLHERPYLTHLFRYHRHGIAIKRSLAAPLKRDTIHILDIDELLLNYRDLGAQSFLFV